MELYNFESTRKGIKAQKIRYTVANGLILPIGGVTTGRVCYQQGYTDNFGWHHKTPAARNAINLQSCVIVG